MAGKYNTYLFIYLFGRQCNERRYNNSCDAFNVHFNFFQSHLLGKIFRQQKQENKSSRDDPKHINNFTLWKYANKERMREIMLIEVRIKYERDLSKR